MQRNLIHVWLLVLALLTAAGCASSEETLIVTERPEPAPAAQEPAAPPTPPKTPPDATPARTDTVEAQRFDQGKLWTFGDVPLDYFQQAYGFRPDSAWLRKARLAALRLGDFCSASFVSARGLVLTAHHCARESLAKVGRPGEDLLETGFYADTLADEREVPGLYVEQFINIEDATERVYAAARERAGEDAGAAARSRAAQALQERVTAQVQARDSSLRVEIVELYSGAQYRAYTYRRYDDVRLVMAPSVDLGFFGGLPDNFTYPRYTLDMAFFRVYGEDGQPLDIEHFFRWSTEGVEPGQAVFVVGNPGVTSRLLTVSQLRFERDYTLPQQLEVLRSRAAILKQYMAAHPQQAEAYDLRTVYFSIRNALKSRTGALEGLHDPYLMARRRAAEEKLREALARNDSLQSIYGGVYERMAQLQRSKAVVFQQAAAFTYFPSIRFGSRILTRGLYAYLLDMLRRAGAPPERLQEVREEALQIKDWPDGLEREVLAARLRTMREILGSADPTVERILRGRSPEMVAERLVARSALADSAGAARLYTKGFLSSDDPAVAVIEPLAALFLQVNQQRRGYAAAEETLNAQIARLRFAVRGTQVPPDATFTLRLSDGRVRGYEYNGTFAPPHTTMYGLYNHYYTYRDPAWSLPERWLSLPATSEFMLSTPLNLVSTNDIVGGSSGSPLLNKELEVVGLVFDSNIQGLSNVYLYMNEQARAVSVSALGMLETLDDVYGADRLVLELTGETFVRTEEAATR